MKLDSDKIITSTSHNKGSLKEGLLMVSNYITVVYKFFLRAHRKQFLHANSSKNKQPQAFKHRPTCSWLFILLTAKRLLVKKRKTKTRIPAKAGRAQSTTPGLYVTRLWLPLGPGFDFPGAGQAQASGATGSCLPTAAADLKPDTASSRLKGRAFPKRST